MRRTHPRRAFMQMVGASGLAGISGCLGSQDTSKDGKGQVPLIIRNNHYEPHDVTLKILKLSETKDTSGGSGPIWTHKYTFHMDVGDKVEKNKAIQTEGTYLIQLELSKDTSTADRFARQQVYLQPKQETQFGPDEKLEITIQENGYITIVDSDPST